jgi:hypothetical protein
MNDLFKGGDAPAKPAPDAKNRPRLHDETDIYAAVVELNRYIARATSDFRRDIKPTYGANLTHEAARLAPLVRVANIAVGAAKLPYLDEILNIVEYIKFDLQILRDLGQAWLPNKTYEASIPLTTSIGKQAYKLRATFASSP